MFLWARCYSPSYTVAAKIFFIVSKLSPWDKCLPYVYISFSPLNYNHHLLSNGIKSLYYTFLLAPDLLYSNICCISFLERFGIFICFSACSSPIISWNLFCLRLHFTHNSQYFSVLWISFPCNKIFEFYADSGCHRRICCFPCSCSDRGRFCRLCIFIFRTSPPSSGLIFLL